MDPRLREALVTVAVMILEEPGKSQSSSDSSLESKWIGNAFDLEQECGI